MRQLPDDLDFFLSADIFDKPHEPEASDFYFDDEPLERILYGEDTHGPSAANLFWPVRKYVQKIITACREGKVDEAVSAASELEKSNSDVSAEMCYNIAQAIGNLFPYFPNPVMKHDLSNLRPLLEKIWAIAIEKKDVKLQHKAGTPLFRWYEHHLIYEEARQVLSRLIEISREHGNRKDEAFHLNNLGFEYLLEGRWQDAVPYFEESSRIFKEENISFEHMNARANYLLCRFELDDLDDMESIEAKVKELLNYFDGSGRWYERKPLILLAKIEERKGNIEKAMELVEKAIESAKGSNTRYPEIDGEYLKRLKNSSLSG